MKMRYCMLIIFLLTGCANKSYVFPQQSSDSVYVAKVYETPGATTPTQKAYSVNGKMYYPKKVFLLDGSKEVLLVGMVQSFMEDIQAMENYTICTHTQQHIKLFL